jgi:hypothetical protein
MSFGVVAILGLSWSIESSPVILNPIDAFWSRSLTLSSARNSIVLKSCVTFSPWTISFLYNENLGPDVAFYQLSIPAHSHDSQYEEISLLSFFPLLFDFLS